MNTSSEYQRLERRTDTKRDGPETERARAELRPRKRDEAEAEAELTEARAELGGLRLRRLSAQRCAKCADGSAFVLASPH